ncbi:hypothetical protein [Agrobacterium pusense]|uniref:hypothetical protein n=1 Tax=Agrobacterium pusense TaxID=648995 RepID=UPI00156AE0E0|nr:hypothetical protein [Agrobacterium pusense]QKJ91575.1 hypothetical protein HQN82_09465 [Agrobacterium pusense]
METALTVIGSLMSLAGGVLGYPLAEMIYDFQHWSIKNDLSNARKMIDKYEAKLEDATEGKSFTNNYYLTGNLYGLFTTQRINASAYNAIHQAHRSYGLKEYSLERHPGIIDWDRTQASYSEIKAAIVFRRENYEDRNTKPLSLILVVTGSLLAIAGAFAK